MRLMHLLSLAMVLTAGWQPLAARDVVEASPAKALAVTVYRDPDRGEYDEMDRDWPQGFAMISETREVTLPAGESTVRFTGVAEGMVAVSAIVTGLPGGVIEKNRNANLLSPAALVDGTLGNRVTITRTNPASGIARSESAVIRTRADGGLVLQTGEGFEAVRCAGLPEKLTFDRVPAGLSADPVFSIDTRSESGGTYQVTLTYLAWGFDWQASYVARLGEARRDGTLHAELTSWLTLVNDNGQSFENAHVMAVAGKLNVTSDFEELADAPEGRPLQLTCYPLGSTASGMAIPYPPLPPPAPAMAMQRYSDEAIIVTGAGVPTARELASVAMVASEEALGDLKLYRVPEPVMFAAKSQKQVAFLSKPAVSGRLVYRIRCYADAAIGDPEPSEILIATANSRANGLGQALPNGAITVYEPGREGDMLVAETRMRDFAIDQDVELDVGTSSQVQAACGSLKTGRADGEKTWMRAVVSNANPSKVTVRLDLGASGSVRIGGLKGTRIKDGRILHEFVLTGNQIRTLDFTIRD